MEVLVPKPPRLEMSHVMFGIPTRRSMTPEARHLWNVDEDPLRFELMRVVDERPAGKRVVTQFFQRLVQFVSHRVGENRVGSEEHFARGLCECERTRREGDVTRVRRLVFAFDLFLDLVLSLLHRGPVRFHFGGEEGAFGVHQRFAGFLEGDRPEEDLRVVLLRLGKPIPQLRVHQRHHLRQLHIS